MANHTRKTADLGRFKMANYSWKIAGLGRFKMTHYKTNQVNLICQ